MARRRVREGHARGHREAACERQDQKAEEELLRRCLLQQTQDGRGHAVGMRVRPTRTSGSTNENGRDASLSQGGEEKAHNSR